jgi:hypothetical protein
VSKECAWGLKQTTHDPELPGAPYEVYQVPCAQDLSCHTPMDQDNHWAL